MTATIAERLAERADWEGVETLTPRGVRLDELFERCAVRTVQRGDDTRYVFADDSEIVACRGGWDVGLGGCYCWDGCARDYPEYSGHNPGCDLADEVTR